MIAGGLSLLFPDCWRKALPSTMMDIDCKSDDLINKEPYISGVGNLSNSFMKKDPGEGYLLEVNDKTSAKALHDDLEMCYNDPSVDQNDMAVDIVNGI